MTTNRQRLDDAYANYSGYWKGHPPSSHLDDIYSEALRFWLAADDKEPRPCA